MLIIEEHVGYAWTYGSSDDHGAAAKRYPSGHRISISWQVRTASQEVNQAVDSQILVALLIPS